MARRRHRQLNRGSEVPANPRRGLERGGHGQQGGGGAARGFGGDGRQVAAPVPGGRPRPFALRGFFGRGLQATKPTGYARRNLQNYRYTTRCRQLRALREHPLELPDPRPKLRLRLALAHRAPSRLALPNARCELRIRSAQAGQTKIGDARRQEDFGSLSPGRKERSKRMPITPDQRSTTCPSTSTRYSSLPR